MTTLDLKERIEAERRADVPGGVCTLDRCVCPTCKTTEVLLRAKLGTDRVTIITNDFRGAAHPYIASVRVDGKEVYRIQRRPDEIFTPDVLRDIVQALAKEVT